MRAHRTFRRCGRASVFNPTCTDGSCCMRVFLMASLTRSDEVGPLGVAAPDLVCSWFMTTYLTAP